MAENNDVPDFSQNKNTIIILNKDIKLPKKNIHSNDKIKMFLTTNNRMFFAIPLLLQRRTSCRSRCKIQDLFSDTLVRRAAITTLY